MTNRKSKIALILSLAFAGCVHFGSELAMQGNERGQIPSLRAAFARVRDGGKLRILLVHGISNHPFGPESEFPARYKVSTYKALEPHLAKWDEQTVDFQSAMVAAIHKEQFDEFVHIITRDLHCDAEQIPASPRDAVEIIRHPSNPHKVLGYVCKRAFSPQEGAVPLIEFDIASWAMPAALEKEAAFQSVDDSTYAGAPESQFVKWGSLANTSFKRDLVNWGLTDAALYVGDYRDQFQWTVAAAMTKTVAHLDARKDSVAVVTHSLGSVIATDTFLRLLAQELTLDHHAFQWNHADHEQVVKMLAGAEDAKEDRPVPIYMFANQYQLIRPAERAWSREVGQRQAGPSNPPNLAKHIQEVVRSTRGIDPRLQRAMNSGRFQVQLVAFTDPEDLLSHPFAGVNGKDEENQDINVGSVNVYVHNPNLIWGFVLANPLDAHLDYQKNPAVDGRILSGASNDEIKKSSTALK